MLFLRVLVRPALMVVGFYTAMVVFNVIGGFIGDGFMLVADTNSTLMGPFAVVGYMAILTIICVMTTHKIYGLITWLPDNVLNWIAQLHTNLGEGQSEGEARNMVLGAVTRQQSAVSGVASNMQLSGKGKGKDKGNKGQDVSPEQGAGVDVAGSRVKQGDKSDSQGAGKTDQRRK